MNLSIPPDALADVDSIDVEADSDANTLTKAHMADLLYQHIGFNKRESKDLVDAFFDQIAERLIAGQEVKLSGFGNFQVRTKAPRPGRNPRTGEVVAIAARRVVTFHASPKLKEAVQAAPTPAAAPGAGSRVTV